MLDSFLDLAHPILQIRQMNKLVVDQATRALNQGRAKYKEHYEDQAMAIGVIDYIVQKLEGYLNECLNVENGKCSTLFRHESCATLMMILYELTHEDKYEIYKK